MEPLICDEIRSDDSPASECVWMCGRGPTRLSCQLRRHCAENFDLEITRNGRSYGTYHFVERLAAVAFAFRLRHVFEGNGWMSS